MGPGEFLNINFYTALFTLVNTVILFFVLKKLLFKPVMKMIDDRQKEIDQMYTDAEGAKENAEAMQREYKKELENAAQTGEKLVKEATQRAQMREEEIIRKANAQADAIRAKAERDVEQEKKKAINDAKNEISGIALAIAGKVVGRSLDEDDQSRLVDHFIENLGDGV